MGQNSPIELQMTAAGLAAKDSVDSIIFTRFVAGAGGNNLATSVAEVKQTIPIIDYQKYTAGNTYNINGVDTVATESSLKITGFANAIDADSNYILNEIGLMAKLSDDGEEFCFAYDWSDTDTRRIRITRSQGIQVVYNIIFSRQPNLTINTSETGVTYADFYSHTQSPVSAAPVHGMTWENGQLTINGQVFDGASNERLKKLVGIDLFYTILPQPVMTLYNKVALMTSTSDTYRCQKTQDISTGQFIINDNGWKRANGSEAEALLVIDDGLTPSANEICLTDAQNHFMEWVQLDNIDLRLSALEANSQFLQYDSLDNRTYNSEWVDRMTGSGTAGSPFCIYTPKDFSMIGKTEQYGLDKCYKLMNNLDFTSVIGMTVSINNEGYEVSTTNQEAPLYNNGEGLWTVGYDGYYPVKSSNTDYYNKTWDDVSNSGIDRWSSAKYGGGYLYNSPDYIGYAFIGELDGNSKVIKGVICAPENTFSVGLFMFLSGDASIHDLTVKDSCFILSNVLLWTSSGVDYKENYLGTLAGIIYGPSSQSSKTVNIFNVYNYATLINNTSDSTSYGGSYTGGLVGYNGNQNSVGHIVYNCANHGNLVHVSETPRHYKAGILFSDKRVDNFNEISNSINTTPITGYKVTGTSNSYSSGINVNCGLLTSYYNNASGEYVLGAVTSYSNSIASGIVVFNEDQSYTNPSSFSSPNWKGRIVSAEYLKSEEFITEANSYLQVPAYVYNDLGVNDGWPLLVDEYNTLTGIDGNLSLAVVDPLNKKIYKAGLPMKKFQTIPTYKEMRASADTAARTFNETNLASLKIVSVTIASNNWSLDSGTNKYKASKSISGITATSPVQLLVQNSGYEISINTVSSGSITFVCDSEPSSDIKVSVMFTA